MGIADRTLCNRQRSPEIRRSAPAPSAMRLPRDPQRCFTEGGGIQTTGCAV
jgi:hypothetical protein